MLCALGCSHVGITNPLSDRCSLIALFQALAVFPQLLEAFPTDGLAGDALEMAQLLKDLQPRRGPPAVALDPRFGFMHHNGYNPGNADGPGTNFEKFLALMRDAVGARADIFYWDVGDTDQESAKRFANPLPLFQPGTNHIVLDSHQIFVRREPDRYSFRETHAFYDQSGAIVHLAARSRIWQTPNHFVATVKCPCGEWTLLNDAHPSIHRDNPVNLHQLNIITIYERVTQATRNRARVAANEVVVARNAAFAAAGAAAAAARRAPRIVVPVVAPAWALRSTYERTAPDAGAAAAAAGAPTRAPLLDPVPPAAPQATAAPVAPDTAPIDDSFAAHNRAVAQREARLRAEATARRDSTASARHDGITKCVAESAPWDASLRSSNDAAAASASAASSAADSARATTSEQAKQHEARARAPEQAACAAVARENFATQMQAALDAEHALQQHNKQLKRAEEIGIELLRQAAVETGATAQQQAEVIAAARADIKARIEAEIAGRPHETADARAERVDAFNTNLGKVLTAHQQEIGFFDPQSATQQEMEAEFRKHIVGADTVNACIDDYATNSSVATGKAAACASCGVMTPKFFHIDGENAEYKYFPLGPDHPFRTTPARYPNEDFWWFHRTCIMLAEEVGDDETEAPEMHKFLARENNKPVDEVVHPLVLKEESRRQFAMLKQRYFWRDAPFANKHGNNAHFRNGTSRPVAYGLYADQCTSPAQGRGQLAFKLCEDCNTHMNRMKKIANPDDRCHAPLSFGSGSPIVMKEQVELNRKYNLSFADRMILAVVRPYIHQFVLQSKTGMRTVAMTGHTYGVEARLRLAHRAVVQGSHRPALNRQRRHEPGGRGGRHDLARAGPLGARRDVGRGDRGGTRRGSTAGGTLKRDGAHALPLFFPLLTRKRNKHEAQQTLPAHRENVHSIPCK